MNEAIQSLPQWLNPRPWLVVSRALPAGSGKPTAFPQAKLEPSGTRKSGSPGNLGQTFSRLQITSDGLMEVCHWEQRQGPADMLSGICTYTYRKRQMEDCEKTEKLIHSLNFSNSFSAKWNSVFISQINHLRCFEVSDLVFFNDYRCLVLIRGKVFTLVRLGCSWVWCSLHIISSLSVPHWSSSPLFINHYTSKFSLIQELLDVGCITNLWCWMHFTHTQTPIHTTTCLTCHELCLLLLHRH